MKSFTIVSRKDKASEEISQKMKQALEVKGWQADEKEPELCLVVGGDGTFLYAVQKYIDSIESVSFLAIHTGTLGFFSSYCATEIEECLEDIIEKEPVIKETPLIEVEVGGKTYYGLNEMRIENSFRTQIMDVYIGEELLETYRGTGLCISTQLGSTAYNRSVHGAVIHEGLNLLQLSEIAGIHHREFQSLGSPLIVSGTTVITIKSSDFKGALLGIDRECYLLDCEKEVQCQLSSRVIKMAQYKEKSYIKRLRGLFACAR